MINLNYINESEMIGGKYVKLVADLMEKLSWLEKFKEKHGIISKDIGIGFSEKEQKWWGWSHRAVVGFGIGDKIFEPNFGDDKTPFVKHGSKTIKNMDDAKKAARAFAKYVS